MLDICTEFAKEYDLIFNAKKTQYAIFNQNKVNNDNLLFGDITLIPTKSIIHLGHKINVDSNSIEFDTHKFLVSFYSVLLISRKMSINTKYFLFKTFCMSLYGIVLMNETTVSKALTEIRKCLRKLFHLHYRTHSRYLPYICNDFPFEVQLHSRFIKFFRNSFTSKNNVIKELTKISQLNCNVFSEHVCALNYSYRVSMLDILNKSTYDIKKDMYIKELDKLSNDDSITIDFILEVISDESGFISYNERQSILKYLCTS